MEGYLSMDIRLNGLASILLIFIPWLPHFIN